MNTTTNTPDTTRLSALLIHRDFHARKEMTLQEYHDFTCEAIPWLLVELTRVERENARLREALHKIVHGLDDYDDVYAAERYEHWYSDAVDLAEHALNGAAE